MDMAAQYVDVLQIPALVRQTVVGAYTGKVVNLKRQFMSQKA
jgi:3-deoxy-D-manno-octulosonic acid (KDO) 8-phosphate synthase